MGAQMVREVASRRLTSPATARPPRRLLAQAIFREGVKTVAAGASPTALKRGIERAVEVAVEEIKKLHKDVKGDMIAQVGTISANNDKQIGRGIIAEAMKKVGKDGVITVEESKRWKPRWEVVEGMQFDRGLPLALLHHRPGAHGMRAGRCAHPDPREENQLDEGFAALLEQTAKMGKPLLIIAEAHRRRSASRPWS